ncbi:MAG TPA: type II toxin-antitoxin system Phd/YefM family antitoxin [Longimicrobiaceae bacterium]|nr:type II toxin-antitoxin system Phd/YefM family antitoxin [Longimicrobiaceae bacterium]
MDDPKPKGRTRKVREALSVPGEGEVVSAADFKTRCLQLMDRVQQERTEVVVTRYGRPVAKLVPYEPAESVSPFGALRGTVTYHGDVVAPVDEAWEADA